MNLKNPFAYEKMILALLKIQLSAPTLSCMKSYQVLIT
jgi:hypothetical protein